MGSGLGQVVGFAPLIFSVYLLQWSSRASEHGLSRQETITNGCTTSLTHNRGLRTTYLRNSVLALSLSASSFVAVLIKLRGSGKGFECKERLRLTRPHLPLRFLASPWLIFHGGVVDAHLVDEKKLCPRAMGPRLRVTLFPLFTLRY